MSNLDTFPRVVGDSHCGYCGFALWHDEKVERECGYLCQTCVGRVTPQEAARVTA